MIGDIFPPNFCSFLNKTTFSGSILIHLILAYCYSMLFLFFLFVRWVFRRGWFNKKGLVF